MIHPAPYPVLCLMPRNQKAWLLDLAVKPGSFSEGLENSLPLPPSGLWLLSLSVSPGHLCGMDLNSSHLLYYVFALLSDCPGFSLLITPLLASNLSLSFLKPSSKHWAKLKFDEHITMYLPSQAGNKAFLPFRKAPVFCLVAIHLHLWSTQHWFTSSLSWKMTDKMNHMELGGTDSEKNVFWWFTHTHNCIYWWLITFHWLIASFQLSTITVVLNLPNASTL